MNQEILNLKLKNFKSFIEPNRKFEYEGNRCVSLT